MHASPVGAGHPTVVFLVAVSWRSVDACLGAGWIRGLANLVS